MNEWISNFLNVSALISNIEKLHRHTWLHCWETYIIKSFLGNLTNSGACEGAWDRAAPEQWSWAPVSQPVHSGSFPDERCCLALLPATSCSWWLFLSLLTLALGFILYSTFWKIKLGWWLSLWKPMGPHLLPSSWAEGPWQPFLEPCFSCTLLCKCGSPSAPCRGGFPPPPSGLVSGSPAELRVNRLLL